MQYWSVGKKDKSNAMKINKVFLPFIIFSVFAQSCEYQDAGFESTGDVGTGGSMARFTIANNHLYTVDNENLKVFDLSAAENPVYKKDLYVGFGVETIFPLNENLFLGTNNGMYIYDISTPVSPTQVSFYEHVIACDPVVSDGRFAYVTLSSTRDMCWRSVDELQIIDLQNIKKPQLIKRQEMEGPRGLAIRNDSLWVCDNGIKIYDVKDKNNIQSLHHFDDLNAYDLILDKDRALVIGESGFVQYKLSNDTIIKLSQINVEL